MQLAAPALHVGEPAPCPWCVLVFPWLPHLSRSLQARLGLKNKGAAFAICVVVVAGVCFSILGALFFSRWVRG